MNYILATDSSCDLPLSYVQDNGIHLFHITSTVGTMEIIDDLGMSYSHSHFYNTLREGDLPTTSQVNVFAFKEQFTTWAKEGISVLYIAFSSGLSGTYSSAVIARDEVLELYPSANITIIDTLCASGGVGFLVYKASQLKQQGKSIEEVAKFIFHTKDNIVHVFTVDDLYHLERGGRLSHASALIGTLLKIKPVLYVNEEGKLIPYQKCRGRKKALRSLAEHFNTLAIDKNEPVMLTHGDCLEEAHFVADILRNECGAKEVIISNIGVAIGSHSGPSCVALCFLANKKIPIA